MNTVNYRAYVKAAREVYEKIVEVSGGDAWGREGLIDGEKPPAIGLDGRFNAQQLEEIAKLLRTLE